ncbi:hypothetical protein [Cellulomonas persica]
MSENDETFTPPVPHHVVSGGAPDPVKATEPVAPPALDETEAGDEGERGGANRPTIMPPTGPQSGVVIPPVERLD